MRGLENLNIVKLMFLKVKIYKNLIILSELKIEKY